MGEKRERKIGRETGVRESEQQKKRHMVGERKIRETGVEERERERERERSRVVKIKNIKKQNLLYGCF